MKPIAAIFLTALLGTAALGAADRVTGLWKIIDDRSQQPNAIALLYEYQGRLYGRILVAINPKTGKVEDTILLKTYKSTRMVGEPAICGMDFVYHMEDRGKEWFGSIIDPEPGDEYECVIRKDGANLTVRGQLKGLGIFGRNQVWMPASTNDLPLDISLPEASSLVPRIPRHK